MAIAIKQDLLNSITTAFQYFVADPELLDWHKEAGSELLGVGELVGFEQAVQAQQKVTGQMPRHDADTRRDPDFAAKAHQFAVDLTRWHQVNASLPKLHWLESELLAAYDRRSLVRQQAVDELVASGIIQLRQRGSEVISSMDATSDLKIGKSSIKIRSSKPIVTPENAHDAEAGSFDSMILKTLAPSSTVFALVKAEAQVLAIYRRIDTDLFSEQNEAEDRESSRESANGGVTSRMAAEAAYVAATAAVVAREQDLQVWRETHRGAGVFSSELRELSSALKRAQSRRATAWLATIKAGKRNAPATCPECGTRFTPARRGQVYDKKSCENRANTRRRRAKERELTTA